MADDNLTSEPTDRYVSSAEFENGAKAAVIDALNGVAWDDLSGPMALHAFKYAQSLIALDRHSGLRMTLEEGLTLEAVILDENYAPVIEGGKVSLLNVFRRGVQDEPKDLALEALNDFYRKAVAHLDNTQ